MNVATTVCPHRKDDENVGQTAIYTGKSTTHMGLASDTKASSDAQKF